MQIAKHGLDVVWRLGCFLLQERVRRVVRSMMEEEGKRMRAGGAQNYQVAERTRALAAALFEAGGHFKAVWEEERREHPDKAVNPLPPLSPYAPSRSDSMLREEAGCGRANVRTCLPAVPMRGGGRRARRSRSTRTTTSRCRGWTRRARRRRARATLATGSEAEEPQERAGRADRCWRPRLPGAAPAPCAPACSAAPRVLGRMYTYSLAAPSPPPPSRTDWTRLVPPPVLIGHVSSAPRRLPCRTVTARLRSAARGSWAPPPPLAPRACAALLSRELRHTPRAPITRLPVEPQRFIGALKKLV
jgi:hypothetical protein